MQVNVEPKQFFETHYVIVSNCISSMYTIFIHCLIFSSCVDVQMVQALLKVLHYFHLESRRKYREVKPVKLCLNSSKKMSTEEGA